MATTPAPSPSPDPCGGATTNLLAALNRPTIGFSACSVKQRESVWELGYTEFTAADGSHAALYPQGFLRFGLARNVEFDVIGPAYTSIRSAGVTQQGWLDMGVGAKFEAFHDDASVGAIDLLYIAPTGAQAFTAGSPLVTLNLDYGRSIGAASGFATTVGIQSSYASDLSGNSARFISFLPSVAFTTQTNPRTQFYFEAYGQTRLRPDGGTLFGLNGGIQYMLNDRFEVDAELGRTVTDLTSAHYIGAGLGFRL